MLSLALLAAEETKSSSASGLITFIPIVLIGAAMYFLLIRPQRKRMREQQGLLRTIEKGDEIITNGGIYGFVTLVDGDTLWVDIGHADQEVEIRIHRSAVQRKVNPAVEPAGGQPQPEPSPGAEQDDEGKSNN
ncbi:MAG: hypothetical protein RL219_35 [Actinomycetota bacterium]|jgi:preprotein translocase subunit YajC